MRLSHLTLSALAVVILFASPARAETLTLIAYMDAASEAPPNDSKATGTLVATYDAGRRLLSWNGSYSGLTGIATAAHFYSPAGPGENAVPNQTPNASFRSSATLNDMQEADLLVGRSYAATPVPGSEIRPSASFFEGSAMLTDAQSVELLAGRYYIKVRTASHPGGEIRGQVIRFDQLWLAH